MRTGEKAFAARVDRIIIIQRYTVTQSPSSGEEIKTWSDLAYRIRAQVAPTRGSERFTQAQEIAEQETTFTIRWHAIPAASRPLTPKDRIIYPVDGIAVNAQTPALNLIHDILSPDEVGRQSDLSIKTVRRADVTV